MLSLDFFERGGSLVKKMDGTFLHSVLRPSTPILDIFGLLEMESEKVTKQSHTAIKHALLR
jgi:hypothetical protein